MGHGVIKYQNRERALNVTARCSSSRYYFQKELLVVLGRGVGEKGKVRNDQCLANGIA